MLGNAHLGRARYAVPFCTGRSFGAVYLGTEGLINRGTIADRVISSDE